MANKNLAWGLFIDVKLKFTKHFFSVVSSVIIESTYVLGHDSSQNSILWNKLSLCHFDGEGAKLKTSIYVQMAKALNDSVSCLNIKMLSYQYNDSHVGDKTVSWPSYLQHGNPYLERPSLYRNGALVTINHSWGRPPFLCYLHLFIYLLCIYSFIFVWRYKHNCYHAYFNPWSPPLRFSRMNLVI